MKTFRKNLIMKTQFSSEISLEVSLYFGNVIFQEYKSETFLVQTRGAVKVKVILRTVVFKFYQARHEVRLGSLQQSHQQLGLAQGRGLCGVSGGREVLESVPGGQLQLGPRHRPHRHLHQHPLRREEELTLYICR